MSCQEDDDEEEEEEEEWCERCLERRSKWYRVRGLSVFTCSCSCRRGRSSRLLLLLQSRTCVSSRGEIHVRCADDGDDDDAVEEQVEKVKG
jgi:hypothetical protein